MKEVDARWNKMYNLAKAYYEYYGDLLIPKSFRTKNGYDTCESGELLGVWIDAQRMAYKNRKNKGDGTNLFPLLTDEQVSKLLKIGMVFEITRKDADDARWNKMYNLAKAYYEHYGNLLVSQSFRTKNGCDFDESGERLGSWIARQRIAYNNKKIPVVKRTNHYIPLTNEQVSKLLKIGMVFESARKGVDNAKWNEMYTLAKAYYAYYGNLLVSQQFRTKNGYDFDEHGKRLGSWIATQRVAYKNKKFKDKITNSLVPLTDEQVVKLLNIGMVFEVRKNRNDVIELCNIYGLDYEKYNFLYRISYFELSSKINFLLYNNMPIVVGGTPNPIFTTSSINMELIYGISLEKLINKYYNSSKKLVKE